MVPTAGHPLRGEPFTNPLQHHPSPQILLGMVEFEEMDSCDRGWLWSPHASSPWCLELPMGWDSDLSVPVPTAPSLGWGLSLQALDKHFHEELSQVVSSIKFIKESIPRSNSLRGPCVTAWLALGQSTSFVHSLPWTASPTQLLSCHK